MLGNALVLFASSVASLLLLEAALMVSGRYEGVIHGTPSNTTIWTRPRNAVEYAQHPDLKRMIANVYDADGVRNHSSVPSSKKRRIYGFFGDSFTENRAVADEFTFTTILDRLTPDISVVNYGVGGFGLDQAYLQYKRFAHHDIEHVFYVFCGNDLRNLYETGLFALDAEGDAAFVGVHRNRAVEFVGRFRVTYLLIELSFLVRNLGRNGTVNEEVAAAFLESRFDGADHRARLHDDYGDSMRRRLLSPNESERREVEPTRELFRVILMKWRDELEALHIPFHVIVLPRASDSAVARVLLEGLELDVLYLVDFLGSASYSNYRFVNDAHWNERGNLFAAVEISRLFPRPLSPDDPRLAALRAEVAQLYRAE